MPKKFKNWLVFFTLIGTLLYLMSSCALFDDRIQVLVNDEERYFSINPVNILESLEQGNTDVFTLLEATPGPLPSTHSTAISWSQDDFFRIAQTLHERSWGESLGSQNLDFMLFNMNCLDIEQGPFSDAELKFFKIIKTKEEDIRIDYHMYILPQRNLVIASKAEYEPNIYNLKPINLAEYHITAEEALQIAEKNGGSEKRLEVDNNCKIKAIADGYESNVWSIRYVHILNIMDSFFTVAVDSQTGKFKVVYPKP